ncbi:hypothetical protein IQ254_10595 [Nodosilinea sp. LEGE 07088]|uniref:hypothetical protein n=1 Tax=Nodosilinea sp. LEGE 07088 TaxID=2777968 RepID=UPI00187F4FAA|nr:hypothetical protein [Nodosilinea sp. LEGE 07088]MBE9137658.1 hypothetical protein [Nodosilinea sp. LEGE 07088]
MSASRANANASFQAALKEVESLFDTACGVSGCTDLETCNTAIAPHAEANGDKNLKAATKPDHDEPNPA